MKEEEIDRVEETINEITKSINSDRRLKNELNLDYFDIIPESSPNSNNIINASVVLKFKDYIKLENINDNIDRVSNIIDSIIGDINEDD